jgi:hypothetical protein
MRVRVPGTVLAVLVAGVTGGCATQVHAQGAPDPAMVISTSSSPTDDPTSGSPTTDPPTTSSPPAPTLDPKAERRITCLLITPSLASAITTWNNYVDKKGGTRTSVATQLTGSATQIDGVLRTSKVDLHDPVRGWGIKVTATLRSMASTLRGGGTPDVGAFNTYKTKLQQACAA